LIKPKILYLLLLGFILSSCRTTRVVEESVDELYKNCYEFIIEFESSTPSGFKEIIEEEEITDIFSDEALLAATSINQTSELKDLIELKDFDELSTFKTYQNILNKISMAELEVTSFTAAIRCEEDKLNQLANHMDRMRSDRANTRTVSGIIIDASSNVLSGVFLFWAINGSPYRQVIGIGASLTQIILNVTNKIITYKAEVEVPINLLVIIKDDDNEDGLIPPHIWYYLNNKIQIGDVTLRESLIDYWEEFTIPDQQDLYFSSEGLYTVDQLENRASMLEQLASNTEIMLQDLLKLRKEIDDYLEEKGEFD
jgi:hypothetical protein